MSLRTILVVEDDPGTLEFYESLLQAAGYAVLSASSGQQTRSLAVSREVGEKAGKRQTRRSSERRAVVCER